MQNPTITQQSTWKRWFATSDLMFLEILLILGIFTQSKEWVLLGSSLVTILYIVFGEDLENYLKLLFKSQNEPQTNHKTSRFFIIFLQVLTLGLAGFLCKILRDKSGNIANRVEGSREWVASLILGFVLLILGIVEVNSIWLVIKEKWEIIGLILSFALMSYGIGKSGYFKYAAYRITESCGGSTTRLTLYLFVLASVLTLITSNDIVILVLTPIIIQIAFYARIKNAKLLLLSQFVAANTLSMGLLIGSPTNIIFATELMYDFLDYVWLMIVPTVGAFMISFIVVDFLNKKNTKINNNNGWFFNKKYILPTIDKKQNYTREMAYWLYSFAFIILLVSLITSFNWSLGWTILGVIFTTITIYSIYNDKKTSRIKNVKEHLIKSAKSLPLQIIPFALIFFVITKELSMLDVGASVGQWIVSSNSFVITTLKSLLGSGLAVNLFNDLPAAAFFSNVVDPNIAGKDMVVRALLVGLNIGCYVTPAGALAGIIWFHQMKDERNNIEAIDKNFDIQIPTRSGLFKYGVIHFIVVTLALTIVLPAISHLYNASISPWNVPTYLPDSMQNYWIIETVSGIGLGFIIMLIFNHILQKNNVVLGDMRVFLGFMTWANARNKEHAIGSFILFFTLIIVLFTVPIFRTEGWDMANYIWVANMVGGGFDFPAELTPKSTLGVILMGILPLASIALLLKLIAVLKDDKKLEDISLQMATGEIQSHRVVIIGYKKSAMDFVGNILKTHNNVFVTILVERDDNQEVREFLRNMDLSRERYDDYFVELLPKRDVADAVIKFNIDKADEVYLFADEDTSKAIAKAIQARLYNQKNQPKLAKNERYPKIFSPPNLFTNPHALDNYVINLNFDNNINPIFNKIWQAIYKNNLTTNNHQTLKALVTQP